MNLTISLFIYEFFLGNIRLGMLIHYRNCRKLYIYIYMYVCMYVCIHNQKLNCDKSDFGSCAVWKMLIWSELRERERERENLPY